MSSRRPSLRRSVVIACASVTLGIACYDFTPITQVAPQPSAGRDAASETDAEGDADAASASNPCVECLSASCSAPYEACVATPKCEALLLCGIREGCFAPNGDRIGCLSKCAGEVQVGGFSDPAVIALLGLNNCATQSCTVCSGQP